MLLSYSANAFYLQREDNLSTMGMDEMAQLPSFVGHITQFITIIIITIVPYRLKYNLPHY